MTDGRSNPSLFSLVDIEKRLDELRLSEDVIELRREVDALVKVAKASLRVADHPFGSISPRDFYALREALAPFRTGE